MSRRLRRAGHISRTEESSFFKILTSKRTGNIPSGGTRWRWQCDIRMDLNQSGAYDFISRHAVAVMHSG